MTGSRHGNFPGGDFWGVRGRTSALGRFTPKRRLGREGDIAGRIPKYPDTRERNVSLGGQLSSLGSIDEEVKLGDDDKMRASTRNITHRGFLTITFGSLIRETPKGCRDCIATIMGDKTNLRSWKYGSTNEKIQRFAIEASKIMEFGNVYSPVTAF